MHHVIISIGSCFHAAAHVTWASQLLSGMLSAPCFSSTLWTRDHHGRPIYYMNRLVSGDTILSEEQLTMILKQAEGKTGRKAHHVTLDLDLLAYDNNLLHPSDWERDYVRRLLKDANLNKLAVPTTG